MPRIIEASSNGRTADFGSAYEGSNPSASASSPTVRAHSKAEHRQETFVAPRVVVGLGQVAPTHREQAAAALREVLGVGARVGPSLDRPKYAVNEIRGQYHATSILRRLFAMRPSLGEAQVSGITDRDLFLAEADCDSGMSLFSLVRLSQGDAEELRHRVRAEAVHSAGPLLGLPLCGACSRAGRLPPASHP